MSKLEIYDCTLREGEQAVGAGFDLERKLKLFCYLDDLGVDYIEVGWPMASEETMKCFQLCRNARKKAKIVAFGSTSMKKNPEDDKNLNSLVESKSETVCIFGKSGLEHVEKQLKISPEENLEKIENSITYLLRKGVREVFYDAEHYFDGFKSDKKYAVKTLISALKGGAVRLILCDTNGGTLPDEVKTIVKETQAELKENGFEPSFGIHAHNDCGLALANTLACLNDITQVQGTINGIGERIGNLNLTEFLGVYSKKNKIEIDLTKLKKINEEAFRLSGIPIPENRPFVGETAFAHKGGVHIDATAKGASYEHAVPEDFGNCRVIVLNTLGGKSSIINTAKEFGFELEKENLQVKEKIKKLYEEMKKYEVNGYRIGHLKAEHFFLIEKYFGELKNSLTIDKWEANTKKEGDSEESWFHFVGKINSKTIEKTEKVFGGPVDAAYKAIATSLKEDYPEINKLKIVDFEVSIVNQMKEESNVRTLIRFGDDEEFETVGVDKNIIASGVEAIVKGFRYYLNRRYKNKGDEI